MHLCWMFCSGDTVYILLFCTRSHGKRRFETCLNVHVTKTSMMFKASDQCRKATVTWLFKFTWTHHLGLTGGAEHADNSKVVCLVIFIYYRAAVSRSVPVAAAAWCSGGRHVWLLKRPKSFNEAESCCLICFKGFFSPLKRTFKKPITNPLICYDPFIYHTSCC